MKPVVLCYEKCSTCKTALKWVEEIGCEVQIRPIKEENPTAEELKEWHAKSGLPLKRFFNTSGNPRTYRKLVPRIRWILHKYKVPRPRQPED